MRIAAILTCFNRRDKTLASLARLQALHLMQDALLSIFLTDDHSQDGTARAVKDFFPCVCVLHGDGSLYWGGGMRRAFAEAMKGDFDFYLWVNDDTFLDNDALQRLLDTYLVVKAQEGEAIVAGSVYDPESGVFSYGGRARGGRLRPFNNKPVQPSEMPKKCFTANGNCLLIPRAIATTIGNISPRYTHSMGDYDYCLRAQKAGFSIWIAPGWLGACSRNSYTGQWKNPSTPLRRRLQILLQPKGLPPNEWWSFNRAHGGPLWFLLWLSPYVKAVFAGLRIPVSTKQ